MKATGRIQRTARWFGWGLFATVIGVIIIHLSGGSLFFCQWRANASITAGHWRSAERWLDRATALAPRNAQSQFLLGRLDRKLGRVVQMDQHLQRALQWGASAQRIELERSLADATAGSLDSLERQLPKLLASGADGNEIAEAFVRGCLQTYRLGDALQMLDVWEAGAPHDPRPPFLRGRILEHQGGLASSEAQYRTALKRQPTYAPAAYSLARTLLEQQHPDAALQYYHLTAIHLYDPQPAYVGAARCYREQQLFSEAAQSLRLADQSISSADISVAYQLVGESGSSANHYLAAEHGHLELAQRNWSAAQTYYERALQEHPQAWRLRYSLAISLRQQDLPLQAQEQIDHYANTKKQLETCDRLIDSLQSNPADADARCKVGQVLLEHISEQQGLVWLNSVFQYAPKHIEAHRCLANYYTQRGATNAHFRQLAQRHLAQLPHQQNVVTAPNRQSKP